jgi:hypothetical protein
LKEPLWIPFSQKLILNIFTILIYGAATLQLGIFLFNMLQLPVKTWISPILIGHITVTAAYAIYLTNGRTYLIIPALLLIAICAYSFIQHKDHRVPTRNNHYAEPFSIKNILVLTTISVIAYLTIYFRVYTIQGELKKIHFDYSFCGGVADYMNQFGIETTILDPIRTNAHYQIYHYFELWNAALFANLFNSTGTQALMLITYPFHLTLLVIGIITFAIENSRNSIYTILLIAFFITPLGILYNKIFQAINAPQLILIEDLGLLTLQGMKLFAVYAVALVFVNDFALPPFNFKAVSLWIISLFIYPTALPFAICILGAFFIFPYFRKSALHYPIYTSIGIGCFIAAFNASAVFYSGHEVFRYLLCFPLLVGVVFIQDKKKRDICVHFLFSVMAAIFISMLSLKIFSPYLNILQDPSVFQLIMNFAQPVCLILSIVILMHIIAERSWIFQTISTSFILACYFLQNIHLRTFDRGPAQKYINLDVVNALSLDPGEVIAFKNPKDYQRSTTSWALYFDIPMDNTRWFSFHYFPVALTLPDSAAFKKDMGKQSLYRNCVKQSSFYEFKLAAANDSISAIQQQFVQLHHISKILFYDHN